MSFGSLLWFSHLLFCICLAPDSLDVNNTQCHKVVHVFFKVVWLGFLLWQIIWYHLQYMFWNIVLDPAVKRLVKGSGDALTKYNWENGLYHAEYSRGHRFYGWCVTENQHVYQRWFELFRYRTNQLQIPLKL